LTSDLAE